MLYTELRIPATWQIPLNRSTPMSMRCKLGDLAVILYDVPGCETNIGRVVAVSGPVDINQHGHATWVIQPVTPAPYIIQSVGGGFRHRSFEEPDILHPDDWMLPVPPSDRRDDGFGKDPGQPSYPVAGSAPFAATAAWVVHAAAGKGTGMDDPVWMAHAQERIDAALSRNRRG
jgi:hypothetical protein